MVSVEDRHVVTMNIEQEVGSDLSNADIADDLVIFEGFCRH